VSKYVEFALEGGGSILIEGVDEPARTSAGFLRDGEHRSAADKAALSFDASVESVRRSADLLVSKLRDLSTPPDELLVSFNLKASGEMGGLAVGKSGGEANYSVTLKWQSHDVKEKEKEIEKEKEAHEVHHEEVAH
jgi:hypothetical protein